MSGIKTKHKRKRFILLNIRNFHPDHQYIIHLLRSPLHSARVFSRIFFCSSQVQYCNFIEQLSEISNHEFLPAWSAELICIAITENIDLIVLFQLYRVIRETLFLSDEGSDRKFIGFVFYQLIITHYIQRIETAAYCNSNVSVSRQHKVMSIPSFVSLPVLST